MKKVKRHHKWFRKQRWNNKLEHDVHNHRTYYSNVYFLTKEPDPRYEREKNSRFWYYEKNIPVDRPERGKSTYCYYKKPEVPYSIHYYTKSPRRSKRQVFIKKKTNKRIRQEFKQKGIVYQNCEYRKAHEFWWELD